MKNCLKTLYILVVLSLTSPWVLASDHADPIFHKHPTESLAGLFTFSDSNNLIVILTLHPGLATPPPIEHLSEQTYQVHFDTSTPVSFSDEQQKLRFGGTVDRPGSIHPDATLSFQLDNQTNVVKFEKSGLLESAEDIEVFTGVRDDPFIFPKFFGTNVIAIALKIPNAHFSDENTFILWGDIVRNDKKIDHVGRANRTMQPRLDFLNTLEPRDHLNAIIKKHDNPGPIDRLLMSKLAPLFAIRDYDKFPDVLIYSRLYTDGFPNGRKLTDDVAALTCELGDCLLWELSFGDVRTWQWPRQSTNDKEFLTSFPFLAEPW